MKILCLCSGGNIRSVATSYLLKHTRAGHDVLAAGVHTSSKETLEMLCNWAETILICGNHLAGMVPGPYQSKIRQLGIGEDIWGAASLKPELLQLANQELCKIGL